MSDLKQKSVEIDKLLQDRLNNLQVDQKNVNEKIDSLLDDFRTESKGDLRENATFDLLKEEIQKNLRRLGRIKEESHQIVGIKQKTYVSVGTIELFSTFEMERIDTKERYIYKVFPGSISYLEGGIISASAPIYQTLEGLQKGDIFSRKNKSTGVTVSFRILDVY